MFLRVYIIFYHILLKFWFVFNNSDGRFYIKCVADGKDDDSRQSPTSCSTPITAQLSGPNKRKLTKSDFNSSKIKVVRCSEESLDNIDAALLSAEKCLEKENSKDSVLKNHSTVSLAEELIREIDINDNFDNNQENNEMSTDKNNLVQKTILNVRDNLSNMSKTDDINMNTYVHNEKSNNNLCSASPIKNSVSYSTKNVIDSADISQLDSDVQDTAYLTIHSITNKKVAASYNMTLNDEVKDFILKGGMIEFDDVVDAYDPTEIDEIVNDIIVFGIRYYLVKWKKWSRGFNTWERFGALYKSQNLLHGYVLKRKKNTECSIPINGIHLMLSRKVVSKLFDLFRTPTGLSLPMIASDDISSLYNSLDIGSKKSQLAYKKSLKWYLASIALDGFRQQQLLRLKYWELDINVMSLGYNVRVENNADLEWPPDSFVYTSKYVPFGDITIPDDPPIGCMCKKNCISSDDCCNEMSGYSAVYDANKNITVAPGYPVFECNTKCKCTSSCRNRVVQLGSKVSVCIYKTRTYGWGVKTNQNIKKGQFVSTYVGEIITVDESERRLENNTSFMDYMWNLDFDDPQNYKYIIDGTHYANFTYFINHSCNSNLNVYAVWINCLDRNLPQLALFASRDILAGEQLTTNYFSRSSPENLKSSGIRCQCNMKNCMGYFF